MCGEKLCKRYLTMLLPDSTCEKLENTCTQWMDNRLKKFILRSFIHFIKFLVAPAHEQSDLSSLGGFCLFVCLFVCLLACLRIDHFVQEINTRWLCPDLKDIPQEVLKDTLET